MFLYLYKNQEKKKYLTEKKCKNPSKLSRIKLKSHILLYMFFLKLCFAFIEELTENNIHRKYVTTPSFVMPCPTLILCPVCKPSIHWSLPHFIPCPPPQG